MYLTMLRGKLSFLLFFVSAWLQPVLAQYSERWQDHLPYQRSIGVTRIGPVIYCASEEALFSFNTQNGEINRLNKLNGLSDYGIACIGWNNPAGQLIIAYKNGNMDVLDEYGIRNIPDLKNSSLFIGKKNINHIMVHNGEAYISTDFGIMNADLGSGLIRETYIIGPGGTERRVYQTAVDETSGIIYAATESGLYSASMAAPLIFYQSWTPVPGVPQVEFNHVVVFNGKPVVNKVDPTGSEDSLFTYDAGTLEYLEEEPPNRKFFLEVINGYLVIAAPFNVTCINSLGQVSWNVSNVLWEPFLPQAAWPDAGGGRLWMADYFNGLAQITPQYGFSFHRPDGPYSSSVFRLTAGSDQLWVAPGSLDANWDATFNNEGLFSYSNFDWQHLSAAQFNDARDFVAVAMNPADPEEIWATAWGSGVYRIYKGELVNHYNSTTTGGVLQPVQGSTSDLRTGGLTFDDNGDLWITNSLANNPLVVRRADGTWQNFSLGAFGGPSVKFKDIIVTQLQHKWLQTRGNGIVVVNDQDGPLQVKKLSASQGSGGLPSASVLTMAEDQDGEIWIGTEDGLGVVYAPENIFSSGGNYDAQPILIKTNEGIYERFLAGQAVTAIVVDGANKKWIGTSSSGVFYVSEDGTETIFQFNTANSPLPSDNVTSIAVDGLTGDVFIGTDRGILSYRGNATEGGDQFNNVFAYPNPVRPGYSGPIFIRGLVTNAQVKITDVAGNIVNEMRAEGGQAIWYGNRFNGERAASGVYLVFLTNDDGTETAVTKILLVN